MQRRFTGAIAAVLMGACVPADQSAFTVSPERASFDGVGVSVQLMARALE